MALRFCDSFDHYTTLTQKGWTPSQYCGITANAMRNGTYGLEITHYTGYAVRSLGANAQTWTTGFAFKGYHATGDSLPIILWNDGSNWQCGIWWVPASGNLVINRYFSGGPVWLYTAAGASPYNTWHYIEASIFFHSSTGTFTLHVDGVELWAGTSLCTGPLSTQCNAIQLGNGGGNAYGGYNKYFDDMYAADDATFLGDVRIECKVPTGAGAYAEWTPSTGNNWECVNEIPPGTADYVGAAVVDKRDTYTKGNLTTTSGTVKGVAASMYAQKTSPGTRSFAALARLGGTDLPASALALGTSWAPFQQFMAKPGGGSWSIADVNSAEFGVKLTA